MFQFWIETDTMTVNLNLDSGSMIHLLDGDLNRITGRKGIKRHKLTRGIYYEVTESNAPVDRLTIEGVQKEEIPVVYDELIAVGKAVKTSYAYNIRSWTKSIEATSDGDLLFKQMLYYNESTGTNIPQYGGNVSAMDCRVKGEGVDRGYTFEYDNLSRLRRANNPVYQTSYSYDKHGNILSLQRYGKTSAAGTYGLVDNLTMSYSGNQLIHVADAAATVSLAESNDFKQGSGTLPGYAYDKNGAMIMDLNKKISSISYNSLSLPKSLVIDGGVIHFNPYNETTPSNERRNPRVGLAHELTHASDHNADPEQYKIDWNTEASPGVKNVEINAMRVENIVRKKTNDKPRTSYR